MSEPDYVERARALAPKIEAWADQIEQERRLPEPLLATLLDAGLFRLLLPRPFNGAEIDPATFVQVMEEVSKADASTAWCLCQTAGCSMASAYLRPDVAAEIFGDDPRAILAWGPPTEARAIAVEGGYRLSGTWTFASCGRHATWLGAFSPVYETDGTAHRRADGTPEVRTLLFPAASATWLDVWHVIGLRGTGSDSFSVSDLFVPHERSIARDDPSERRYPGRLYLFPIVSLFAAGFAGVALGIARSSLDAFVDLARTKTPRGFRAKLRESAVIQARVAQAEARIRSARLFLLTSLAEIWQAAGGADRVTLEQRILIRMAASHAIREAAEVVDSVYHAAGATAIFASNAFERRFRDMHTVTQQLQGRLDHFEMVGRFLLGLEPDTQFL